MFSATMAARWAWVKSPVHRDPLQACNPVVKPPHQGLLPAGDGVHAGGLDKVQGGGEAHDAVAVQSARLQPGGVFLRLGPAVGLHPRAAHLPGADLHTGADAQPARCPGGPSGPLWPVKQRMSMPHGLHVDGGGPGSLGGVHDEEQAVGLGNGPHPGDVDHVARQIGGVGAHDGPLSRAG